MKGKKKEATAYFMNALPFRERVLATARCRHDPTLYGPLGNGCLYIVSDSVHSLLSFVSIQPIFTRRILHFNSDTRSLGTKIRKLAIYIANPPASAPNLCNPSSFIRVP